MYQIATMNYINSPVETVYKSLTSKEGLSSVWTTDCQVKNKVGETCIFGFGNEEPTEFRIVELIPNKEITWICTASDPEWIGTQVSFELKYHNGKTAITLVHSGWKSPSEFFNWCSYNWSFFLHSLKLHCEEGAGIPFQERKF